VGRTFLSDAFDVDFHLGLGMWMEVALRSKAESKASDRSVRPTRAIFIRANQPTTEPESKDSGFFMR